MSRDREPSAVGVVGRERDDLRSGRHAGDAEPHFGQVSDTAASGPAARQAAGPAGRLKDAVTRVLRQRLGIDAAAAEAIVSGLRRHDPAQDAFSVYLDLNHWISLSKTRVGHPDGARYLPCLDILQQAMESGKVILPLGRAHYMEVSKIKDVRQRADIANTMAVLSGFTTLAARKHRLRCEVAQALHQHLGRPLLPERLRPFGRGFAFAVGVSDAPAGRVRLMGGASAQRSPQYLAELAFVLNQAAEYLLLRGPAPGDLASMPEYDPSAGQIIADARAYREQELFELLRTDPADKRRLGDIAHARGLYWELGPQLPELLAPAGLSVESFFYKGKEWITSFLDMIPALAVRTSLVMQTNKNGTRAWTRNDIYDIDALEAAVPYCDVVVTEKYACHVMNQSRLADRFATKVVSSLDDLTPILQSLA
ncbi:MAG: hypothetical protein ACRDP5_04635 [Streptosporangiaceae bacterium]